MIGRFFLLAAWLGLTVAPAEEARRRMLETQHFHLGVAGMPEWQEFERTTPHGTQLNLTFSGQVNATDATLFIRQRNVKATWNVMLNGRKLGALETLTQPLTRVLTVPAGALKD